MERYFDLGHIRRLMSLGSIVESIDKGIALLGTVLLIFIALLLFVVTSTADDAIWDGLGHTFTAMGRGDLAFAWGILGFILGIVAIVGFLFWAYSKVRESI